MMGLKETGDSDSPASPLRTRVTSTAVTLVFFMKTTPLKSFCIHDRLAFLKKALQIMCFLEHFDSKLTCRFIPLPA